MELLDFLASRHSVRRYSKEPISSEDRIIINDFVKKLSEEHHVHMEVYYDHDQAFKGLLGRVMFDKASNIIVFYHSDPVEAGYASVPLLLRLHQMGLATCYVGATYKKQLFERPNETIQCALAFGHGKNSGEPHKNKKLEEFYDESVKGDKNAKYIVDVLATAPSAMNRQEVKLVKVNGKYDVVKTTSAPLPFSDFDLGIYRYYLSIALMKDKDYKVNFKFK